MTTAAATLPVMPDAGVSASKASGPARSQGTALVIGNAEYAAQPLRTPVEDSRALGRLLRSMGFEVIALENATRRQISDALGELKRRLSDKGIGLVYFAGHALQLEGSVVLLPTDAHTGSLASVRDSGINMNEIAAALSFRPPRQPNLIIVDACLNSPFHEPVNAARGSIPRVSLPDETLLAFATSSGGIALDGPGKHGLFTEGLLSVLPERGLTADQIFGRVRSVVRKRTASVQVPSISSTLSRALRLPASATRARPRPPSQASLLASGRPVLGMLTRGILPQSGEARIELEFWKAIENSTDASDYEAYLEKYPDGRFAPLAKARAARYKKSERPAKESEPAIEEMDVEYVASSDINLRDKPSSQAQRVGRLTAGSSVHVTGRLAGGKWYRVRTPSGDTAYVWAELLSKAAPPRSAPEAPSPSATTPAPETAPSPKTAQESTPPPAPSPPEAPSPSATAPEPEAAPSPKTAQESSGTQDCPACPVMVVLPPGTFIMGDNRGDRSEKPAHKVTISRPFAIGKYEVTTAQWKACVDAGGCTFKAETSGPSPNSPVRDISWSDAQQYVQWLKQSTKQPYRLPTEAEWEYAARAGTKSRYWWGDDIGAGNADCKGCGPMWNHDAPAEVGTFPANPFGLSGMNGGVWEWVSDCWYKSHAGAPSDGSSRDTADCREHVIRGGAWRNDSTYVHSASRFKYDTNVRYLMNGFRVAKTLQ